MTERRTLPWTNLCLLTLAGGLLAASVVFHVVSAATGRFLYRDNHLGTAIEYAKTHIDLLNPIIVGFNATGTPTPQEFPFWQAAAAVAFKVFGPWYGWANIVSLLLFSTCLYPLYQTATACCGARCACWTLIFFLAEPLVFLNAGVAGADGFSLAAEVWFVFFSVKLIQSQRLSWWLPAFFAGTVAALAKMPFFMAAGLALFFLTIVLRRTSVRTWIAMGSLAVCIGLIFRAWTAHTDRCIGMAEFGYVDLRVSDQGMVFWYFGDWQYRLSLSNWLKGAWRFLNGAFGSIALAGVFATSIVFVRQHVLGKLWFLGALITALIFTQLVLHHWHYYLMFTPAVALICAQTAVAWEKSLVLDSRRNAVLGIVVLSASLLLSIAQGLVAMRLNVLQDPFARNMANIVKRYTKESDKLVIAGGGWGGEVLFLADRQGLSIWNTKFMEDPKNFKRLKELGYTRLVLISQSPLLYATMVSSGGGNVADKRGGILPRETYRLALTDGAKSWPTVYQDPDDNILIKELP